MEKPGTIEFAAMVAARFVFADGLALIGVAAGEDHAAGHVSDLSEQISIEHEANTELMAGSIGVGVGVGALTLLARCRRNVS